jgi:hypothetical protein
MTHYMSTAHAPVAGQGQSRGYAERSLSQAVVVEYSEHLSVPSNVFCRFPQSLRGNVDFDALAGGLYVGNQPRLFFFFFIYLFLFIFFLFFIYSLASG